MDEKPRTAHSSTQTFGLALMSAAVVTLVVVSLILFGADEEIGFFVGVAAALVVVTILVWRFDATWSRILGLVLTLASGLFLFWLAFGVFTPFSPLEFIVGLAFLVGFVVSLVGGIRAISAGRKGVEGPTDGETRLRKRLVTGLVALSVVSIVGLFVTRGTVSEAEASGAVTLDMFNFEFDPHSSTVPAGGKLLVHNSDAFAHDFTLDALGIAVTIGPGGEALVDLSGAAPGTYSYICTIHTSEQDSMEGVLTVGS